MPSNRPRSLSLFGLTLALLTASAQSNRTVSAVSGNSTQDTDVARRDGAQCQEFVRLDDHKLAGLIASRTPLRPPNRLHNSELHGKLTIEVSINDKGEVVAVRAIKGQPLALTSALESVQHWQFRPYKQNGAAVCVGGDLIVKYDFRSQK